MFKFRLGSSKKTFADKVKQSDLDPEIKEIFIGRKTIFSIMGFIVGGVMFGNALLMYAVEHLGLFATMLIGFILFIISGILSREFKR
jgi:hypothetical protein